MSTKNETVIETALRWQMPVLRAIDWPMKVIWRAAILGTVALVPVQVGLTLLGVKLTRDHEHLVGAMAMNAATLVTATALRKDEQTPSEEHP